MHTWLIKLSLWLKYVIYSMAATFFKHLRTPLVCGCWEVSRSYNNMLVMGSNMGTISKTLTNELTTSLVGTSRKWRLLVMLVWVWFSRVRGIGGRIHFVAWSKSCIVALFEPLECQISTGSLRDSNCYEISSLNHANRYVIITE